MKRPILYVVEMQCGERWEPCCSVALTLREGKFSLAEWRAKNPSDTFRLWKYRRSAPAVERKE